MWGVGSGVEGSLRPLEGLIRWVWCWFGAGGEVGGAGCALGDRRSALLVSGGTRWVSG